ncbi:MAG: hypothetical protein CMQ41_05440 [Gammaproteobacteria bacterium]|nr:hypothetical protein [Gammaproteobacteria bacterium]
MSKSLPIPEENIVTTWFNVVCDKEYLDRKHTDVVEEARLDAVLHVLKEENGTYNDKRTILRQLCKRIMDQRNFRSHKHYLEMGLFIKSSIHNSKLFVIKPAIHVNKISIRNYTWGELVDALPNVTLINLLADPVRFEGHPMDMTKSTMVDSLRSFFEALGKENVRTPDPKSRTGVIVGLNADEGHWTTYNDCYYEIVAHTESRTKELQIGTDKEYDQLFDGKVTIKNELSAGLNALYKEATGRDETIETSLGNYEAKIASLETTIASREKDQQEKDKEIDRLRQALSAPTTSTPRQVDNDAEPMTFTTQPAWELFLPEEERKKRYDNPDHKFPGDGIFELRIPCIDWGDAVHPDVPEIDEKFLFHPDTLAPALYGMTYNKPTMVYGHTGTGKSSFVNQIGARTKFPTYRLNLDSEITRLDLIGRDTLIEQDGITVSKFVDGILPRVMSKACIIQCDEVDFARPDVLYALQPVLEEGGTLRVTEDGGRMVQRHEWCNIFATANTRGQGDEYGMYQGARVQSQAFLDRFQMWIEMPYLTSEQEAQLIREKVPGVSPITVDALVRIANNIREAFMDGRILTTVSPRGLCTAAHFMQVTGETGTQCKAALKYAVVNKASDVDVMQINEFVEGHIK